MNDPFNRPFRLLFGLCGMTISLAFGTLALPAFAANPGPTIAAPTYLSADEKQPVAPDGGPPTPGTDRYDFGIQSVAQTSPIEHTFLLRNAGAKPLTVDHIQPSCGCTTALADGAAEGTATVVNPGGQLRVHVSVDPGHLSPGQITKSVWIFLRDQSSPAATLLVTGTIRPAASFSPAVINFGQVKAGATPFQTVTVTLDPSLASAGHVPQLVSSDPAVTVAPRPAASAGSWAYIVSLSPKAHLGVLSGSLSLVTAAVHSTDGSLSSSVPVIGTIVGDVTASPASVAFGTVKVGKVATQQIFLSGATPTALSNLTVRAVGTYVTARLRPPAPGSRYRRIRLNPHAGGFRQPQSPAWLGANAGNCHDRAGTGVNFAGFRLRRHGRCQPMRVLSVFGIALMLAYSSVSGTLASSSDLHPIVVRPAEKPVLKAAMPFTLVDADGKKHSLADYQGRPVVLFFFCGCPWCVRCAQDWGRFQRGGALPSTAAAFGPTAQRSRPLTLVVFSGDAAAAREFAMSTGLDHDQTVLLPDVTMHVTLDLYHAEPCPRVFVVDPHGLVHYTNNHKDDAPRQASEMVIASRALDALRACSVPPHWQRADVVEKSGAAK